MERRELSNQSEPLSFGDFEKVSDMINKYNQTHPGEMLSKTPEELMQIYKQGLSIILKQGDEVLSHAALWPLLQSGNETLVAEFGSWIVNPAYRHHRINGITLGEHTASLLLKSFDSGVIATVKRKNSLCGLQRVGFEPLDYYRHPLITALTCVCSEKAEHLTGTICSDRRREGYGLRNAQLDLSFTLNSSQSEEPPRIPCTLLGYNLKRLVEIEQELEKRTGFSGINTQGPYFFVEFLPKVRELFY